MRVVAQKDEILHVDDTSVLIAESQVLATIDVSYAFVHKVLHPTKGRLFIITSPGAGDVILQM